MIRRRWTIALALALLAGAGAAQEPGKPYFWLRMWPDLVARYDIESDQVVDRIQLHHGVCHGFQASHDESQLFLVTGQRTYVEVVDVAQAEWLEEHSFEEPERIVRVDEIRERPGGERWYVKIDRVKKEPDHYVVEEPEWLDYDRTGWEIGERMKELPEPIRRGARISPAGDEWHVFGRDITIVDPATLEEKGKILLSRPLYGGMGPLSIRGDDLFEGKNPDAYRLLYTMRDPVKKNRSLMGIVDIDIPGRRVAGVHEWGAAPRVWQFLYTRDKKTAVAQLGTGERQNQYDGEDPVATLVTYDVETGARLRETRVDLRNGLRLVALSPDGKKLYFGGRGHELVVYDDQHEYVKTVELEGETEGQILTLGG